MHSDFDFVDGQFVPSGGPVVELRQMLARGEVEGAAKHYEETGAAAREGLLEEAASASFETKRSIAAMFVKARDFGAAAKTLLQAKLEAEAAPLFEQARDFASAAACWVKAGESLKAAAAHERAGNADAALALYRQAGAAERVADCLARARRFGEAAKAYRALNNAHAEVESLKAGLQAQPSSLEFASRLAELMLQHGRADSAAQLLTETTKHAATAKDDARFLQLLVLALDATGNRAGADKVRARLGQLPHSAGQVAVVTVPPAPARPAPATDAYGFLKALPMFADLSMDDMKALYRVCTLVAFEPGQHLIEVGQPGRGLFVIVEGQVDVFAGAEASARLLNSLTVGGHLGEISLVQDAPTSARVTAKNRVKALFISREAFHQYVNGSPPAGLRIYQLFASSLAERVRALSAR